MSAVEKAGAACRIVRHGGSDRRFGADSDACRPRARLDGIAHSLRLGDWLLLKGVLVEQVDSDTGASRQAGSGRAGSSPRDAFAGIVIEHRQSPGSVIAKSHAWLVGRSASIDFAPCKS